MTADRARQEALDALAATAAPDIVARARAEAEARVQALLVEELTAALLRRIAGELGPADTAAPDPARTDPVTPDPVTDPATTDVVRPDPSRPNSSDPDVSNSSGPGVYVYGIIAAGTAAAPDMTGVDGHHPVTTVTAGGLEAIVSQVPLGDFDEHALHEHLGDLDWVERVARAHETVLEAAAAETAVVPLRLCSIYRDEAGVRGMLEREADTFAAALRQLDGAAEWGVKAFAAPRSRGRSGPSTADESGGDYLRRRHADEQRRGQADTELASLCETVHHRLSELSVGSRVLAVHRREVSGHAGEMILNGAYLVPREETDAFHEAVAMLTEEATRHDVELELTGPWPAYNFVGEPAGAAP